MPSLKMHCAVLSVDGLRSAIRAYEEKHGLVEIPRIDESFVRSRLRHVMNPQLGRDILSTGTVKEIRVNEGRVDIVLNLPEGDQFRNYLLEEIRERLEGLPGINELSISLR